MKERKHNVAVGLTVLVALGMFAVMVLLFTGLPEMFEGGWVLRAHFAQAYEARVGDWVHLAGLQIGRVTKIGFCQGDPRKGVEFELRIERGVQIPGNIVPRVYSRGLVGGAFISLDPFGPPRMDPATHKPLAFLPPNWPTVLEGERQSEGMFPKELVDGLKGLAKLGESLNDLIGQPPGAAATTQGATTGPATTHPSTAPSAPNGTLRDTFARLGKAVDSVDAVLGSQDNQANIKLSLANLAVATAKASEAMTALKAFADEAGKAVAGAKQTVEEVGKTAGKFGTLADNADRHIGELSQKLIADAEKLSQMLSTLNQVATKIDSGQGSAGQLLNDPKLYNNLLEASQQLTKLMEEFRAALEQWKARGIPLKLK
jgi:phospholipid/cholesterol/gamma-HCH transport system substrate-binding protein